MKSMLYIGATLMIGASIYGFVDYKQTHGKKAFKDMYAEEKKTVPTATPAPSAVLETPNTPPEKEKKSLAVKNKTKSPTDPVPAGITPLSEEDKPAATAHPISKEELPRPEPSKENKVVKKKKVRKEFFSRGRMPEEEILIETPKKESKKSVPKE